MRPLFVVLALFVSAVPALAEPVTYHMTGIVDAVSDGSANTIDLRGSFTVGAAITLDLTVDRSTPPVPADAYTFVYPNLGMNLQFTIGGYACTGVAGAGIIVTNDYAPLIFDDFTYAGYTLSAPVIGGASSSLFSFDLNDVSGTALGSGALPRPMPAMTSWSTKTFTLQLADPVLQTEGAVTGTFDGVTTPARDTSWGAIKGLYR
jgi:hypothetical protein